MVSNPREAPLEPVQWIFEEMNANSTNKQIFGNCYCIQFYLESGLGFNSYVIINNTFRIYSSPTVIPVILQAQWGQLDTTVYNITFPASAPASMTLHIARLVPRLYRIGKNLMK